MTDKSDATPAADKCPVDHKSREVWLQQARAAQEAGAAPPPLPPHPIPSATAPAQPQQPAPGWSWNPSTWRMPGLSSSSSSSSSSNTNNITTTTTTAASTTASTTPSELQTRSPSRSAEAELDEHREVSSIPRAMTSPSQPTTRGTPSAPVNHEMETGADARTGNWVYPSERMFFEALRRKGSSSAEARAADMRTVVPIHNAVNERAWREIRAWEAPHLAARACGGPRLESFAGRAGSLSPRARLNTWLGYSPPFDRHDWVVDRCGTRVEYVIDFYAGRPGPAPPAGEPARPQINFYLDVRPKLNSWEGVKMRLLRFVGAT